LKYSFHPDELNNWKGRITESLVQKYIYDVLKPKLEKKGYDLIIRDTPAFHLSSDNTSIWVNRLKTKFLEYGVFPDDDLCNNNSQLLSLLTVATDGLLFKLKYTGKSISRKKAVSELYFENYEMLPPKIELVSGEVEVIEIKADKAYMQTHQKKAYSLTLENGYKLRYFHVFIISFVKNQYEIEEKALETVDELNEIVTYFRKLAEEKLN
jgi:hypothetical protein